MMTQKKKMSEHELRAEVEKLLREGRMPSLRQVLAAITETKAKYAPRIRRARRDCREQISIN
jgi:hypothetical protein